MEKRTTKVLTRKEAPSWFIAKRVARAHGLSYKELAQRMGISENSITHIVNRAPSILHVKMLADAIGCSFFDFFDFTDTEAPAQATLYAVSTTLAHRPTDNIITCPHCNQQFAIVPINAAEEEPKKDAEKQNIEQDL